MGESLWTLWSLEGVVGGTLNSETFLSSYSFGSTYFVSINMVLLSYAALSNHISNIRILLAISRDQVAVSSLVESLGGGDDL